MILKKYLKRISHPTQFLMIMQGETNIFETFGLVHQGNFDKALRQIPWLFGQISSLYSYSHIRGKKITCPGARDK